MRTVFTYLLMPFLTVGIFSQQETVYFSDALDLHLPKYVQSCERAVVREEFHRLDVLFDSLVNTRLRGTLVDSYKLNKLDGGYVYLDSLERPMLLITTTSWLLKNDEEIEAINSLADEFEGKIDVVILFWDNRKAAKQTSTAYSETVIVTYIDELENKHNEIINDYKHALGIPTAFYISSAREIMDIDRGGIVQFSPGEDSELYAANYKLFHSHIFKLLLSDGLSADTILSTTD